MVNTWQSRSGVTFIEMLVVLLIILGLLGILYPALNGSRESAREIACRNNLRQLALAMRQHVDLHRDPPDMHAWTVELLPFLEETATLVAVHNDRNKAPRPSILVCPSHPDFGTESRNIRTSLYVMLIARRERKPRRGLSAGFRDRSTDLSDDILEHWVIGPEVDPGNVENDAGPHRGRRYLKSY